MNETLTLVVAAIVILITALIVITILSTGIGKIADFSATYNFCIQRASTNCASFNGMPTDWSAPVQYKEGQETKTASCNTITGGSCQCTNYVLDCGT
jgi:hypothetical protein